MYNFLINDICTGKLPSAVPGEPNQWQVVFPGAVRGSGEVLTSATPGPVPGWSHGEKQGQEQVGGVVNNIESKILI